MLFSRVTESFSRMSTTTSRLELGTIMSELFMEAGPDLRKVVYLAQGKLAPDFMGIETGMADRLIMKALSTITGTAMEEINQKFWETGDLGQVAGAVLQSKKQLSLIPSELSVEYVFNALMKIAGSSGEGSIRSKTSLYENLIINSSVEEAIYITRILTGKLRLGVSDSTILKGLVEAFSTKEMEDAIEEAYNFHPDMGRIAEELRDGRIDELLSTGPVPLIPCKVMLAERLPSIQEILDRMGGTASFEYKYDGLRTQIHKSGDTVKIFSRGNEETTSNFPDIRRAFLETFKCDSCIVDGEAVPYNPETGELYPFQMVSQRRGRKYAIESVSSEIPLAVFLFDIINLDGKALNKVPYQERRRILEGMFTENDNFKLAKRIVSSDEKQIMEFFLQSVNDGCEGVVAKNVTDASLYRAGARGWLWIKFKRDYQEKISDSLDLVVVGAFSGHGKRKGRYGALLMASYNRERDMFETVCKLGTGFTDETLESLTKIMEPHLLKSKPARVDSILEADFWIEPAEVMEILGAEITVSPVHTCYSKENSGNGLALRFPRFTGRWRTDKKPEDATQSLEIHEMLENQNKKMGTS